MELVATVKLSQWTERRRYRIFPAGRPVPIWSLCVQRLGLPAPMAGFWPRGDDEAGCRSP